MTRSPPRRSERYDREAASLGGNPQDGDESVLMTDDSDEILEKLLREKPIYKLIKQALEEHEP